MQAGEEKEICYKVYLTFLKNNRRNEQMSQIDFNVLRNPEMADDEARHTVQIVNDYNGGENMDYLSEPHVACCLLVDTSGSMQANGKIQQLNEALRNFKETVCRDPLSRMRVDICVIAFATDVTIVTPFCPIMQFEPPTLYASGATSMGKGIRFALEAVHEEVRKYHGAGVECFKPFVLMITDGYPTDDIEGIADLIAAREGQGRYGHLLFHAFGVKGADMALLARLTKRVLAINMNAFDEIFNWTSRTLQIISHSKTSDNITWANLTSNMYVYTGSVPWDD